MKDSRRGFPPFILDLSHWYAQRKHDRSLPDALSEATLEQLYEELELYPWVVKRHSLVQSGGIAELPWDFHQEILDQSEGGVFLLSGSILPEHIQDQDWRSLLKRAAAGVHAKGAQLFVRVSGCAGDMLQDIAESGVDCIEGVCCPPQGDTMMAKARSIAGNHVLLWGGLPQESLLPAWGHREFRKMAQYIAEEACCEPNEILGAAGGVPPGADISRIRYLAELYKQMEEVFL